MKRSPQPSFAPVVWELRILSGMLVLRGLVSILVGVFALVAPLATLAALVLLFGAYAIVDGVVAIVSAARSIRRRSRAWPQIVHGSVGMLVGIGTFAFPPVTELALLVVVAVWATAAGAVELTAAVRLRGAIHGAWLLALYAVLSLAFGVFLILFPGAGLVAVATLIGIYSLVRGAVAVWVGLHVRGALPSSSAAPLAPHLRRYS